MNFFVEIRELIEINLADLFNIDWPGIQFKQASFAVWAAIILIAAFLLKILWHYFFRTKNKSFYEHSGYHFASRDKPGFWHQAAGFIPIVLAGLASFFLLVTIADPYVLLNKQSKSTQSREIIYLEDTSVSMGFKFKNQQISRAEIVRDFILKLIAERRDKNDRAAFIIYASNPYRIADFTTDTNGLLFSVENGPLVIADPDTPKIDFYKGMFIVKDFMPEAFGGESDLFLGLETANKLFEEKGDPKITEEIKKNPAIKRRSIIIATDGASSRDPEPQFKELTKRGIVPFLVFIDPDKNAERKIHGSENVPQVKLPEQLLRQARTYGGEYFIAANRSSLSQIRQRLDRLNPAVIEVKSYTVEQHIYRPPLVASLVLFIFAILARLIFWRLQRVV